MTKSVVNQTQGNEVYINDFGLNGIKKNKENQQNLLKNIHDLCLWQRQILGFNFVKDLVSKGMNESKANQ